MQRRSERTCFRSGLPDTLLHTCVRCDSEASLAWPAPPPQNRLENNGLQGITYADFPVHNGMLGH